MTALLPIAATSGMMSAVAGLPLPEVRPRPGIAASPDAELICLCAEHIANMGERCVLIMYGGMHGIAQG